MTATLLPQPAAPATRAKKTVHTVAFSEIRRADLAIAGGKGANLGEMTAAGLPVPPGFIVTTTACTEFFAKNNISARISADLSKLDPDDTVALTRTAAAISQIVRDGVMPDDVRAEIEERYDELSTPPIRVAVRSSATAEDTVQFSFAGMFESFLNVPDKTSLLNAVKGCWASAFGARVLFYRLKQGMPGEMAVAVIVQRMVDSDKSGVIFTTDPASRDASRIVIEAAWGLGESVVQGAVTPDRHVLDKNTLDIVTTSIAQKEFLLEWSESKKSNARVDLRNDPRSSAPVLNAAEIKQLGELARRVEKHYGVPQDIEFAIEGEDVFLTQSRPITTLVSAVTSETTKADTKPVVSGLGASPGIATGVVRVLASPSEGSAMQSGEILVTRMTSPDWVPIMRRATAIVTDSGGMTSHAAIVARELGTPCIVGAHDATRVLATGELVTVDGAAGTVIRGKPADLPHAETVTSPPHAGTEQRLVTATKLYVNLGEPDRAAAVAALDVDGVGLLRAEFMMLEALEHMHPREFLARKSGDEFVKRMAAGLTTFAKSFSPRPVIYRAMDFRTNEFRDLEGGAAHEPHEANPMIGYRGCFRYTREPDLFNLEMKAIADVRRSFPNVHLMIPFVRTAHELEACMKLIDDGPLGGDDRMERWIMAEVPSVIFWLPRYASLGIDGVSIGSNDLTQLMLGVDRDSDLFGDRYDERDGAVLDAIRSIILRSKELALKCSICGQAPSVHPEYAEKLVGWGIHSISVSVDAIDRTRRNIAAAEQMILLDSARAQIKGAIDAKSC
ncbi:MAG: phosphoenolpyruvate synthase [Gemmatimonas sp.]